MSRHESINPIKTTISTGSKSISHVNHLGLTKLEHAAIEFTKVELAKTNSITAVEIGINVANNLFDKLENEE